ncbi:Peptidyl-prolyl cis-trans isomerase FKBP62 [Bienertia sinuspersici]
MDDALEQYGYAQLILARYNFVKENDRIEFLKLAICILMNSAVCFSKKKEFVQVGQICSIVLEFNPNNVKAMFKRVVAGIELGKHDRAMLDLLTPAEIDPNNKAISNKLEEVKNSTHKKPPNSHPKEDTQIGFGIGLPTLKRKATTSLTRENKLKEDESQATNYSIITEH